MQKTLRALKNAIHGFCYALINERNFRTEILCAVIVIAMAFVLKVSATAWLVIVLNISLVLTAELFNTAIEKLADVACKEINPIIKIIKDIAAGAVVIAVLNALVCGLIIFVPIIFKNYFI